MLDLLKWLQGFVKEKPREILLFIVIVAGFYFIPKFANKSDAAAAAQFNLIQKELDDCRAYNLSTARVNDSLRGVIQKQADDRIKDQAGQIEALRRLADKYRDANMKAVGTLKTIDNIQKTVNNEISN